MKRYYFKVLSIFLATGLVLVQYQNCGSSNALNADADSLQSMPAGIDGGDLSVINPVNTGSISFVKATNTVNTTDKNISIIGTCSKEQNRALLGWEILDSNGVQLFNGQSICSAGLFNVEFEGVEDLACGSKLTLKAYFGAQAQTQTIIAKNCN